MSNLRRALLPSILLLAACGGCGSLLRSALVIDPATTHAIPSFTIPPERPDVAYERFIVVGDMGSGHADQARVAAAMAHRAKTDSVDFWLTTGDNFYPSGVSSVDDPQWESKFEEVYADPALQIPLYPTLGNHDHLGNPLAQIEYSERKENWRMAGFFYTFIRRLADGTEIQFFVIDTTPISDAWEGRHAQLDWLDRELALSAARWKLVFGHHPLYGHNPRRGYNLKMIEAVEPLFIEHGVDLYFAGHDHTLEMIKPVHGVHHVISGGGGGPDWAYPVLWTDESYYVATLGGFTLCRISKDELVIEFVRMDGQTEYAHTLTK